MHLLVVAPLLELSSAEDAGSDGPLARRLDSSPSGIGHCSTSVDYFGPLPVTPRGST